jgi:mannose-6-phosphate isomerase-like protein (cupin superfamily)
MARPDGRVGANRRDRVTDGHGTIVPFDELEHSRHSHEFVGAEHSGVPFCVILVHSQPGVGPKLHRHPYAEVFIVEDGQATFRIGDSTAVVAAGNVVVSPPGEAHGFVNSGDGELRLVAIHVVNSGDGELRLVAIHGASRFDTEWLEGVDPTWTSKPRE